MRNKKIEAILEAWWNLERGGQGAQALHTLNTLLDEARQGTPFSREQMLDNLWGHYKEFKRTRKSNEKLEDQSSE